MSSRVRLRHVMQLAATVVLPAMLASAAGAAPGGALDRSFGDRGFAVVDGATSCLTGEGGCAVGIGLAIQPDGAAVVAAGTLESDCRSRFAIVRLRAGRLDPAFGRAGRLLTRFGSSAAIANAVVVAPDGRIVVAGERQPLGASCGDHVHLGDGDGFALARYHRDGTLDRSFGGDGTVVTMFEHAGAVDLLLQGDGKIVAVGSSAGNIALARYLSDGRLDSTFGHGGAVVLPSRSRGGEAPGRPALDQEGRIVVPLTPGCWPCAANIVRYTHDGSLDHTFGDAGTAHLPLHSATAVKAAGRWLLAVGVQQRGPVGFDGDRVAIARISSTGAVDPTFGRNGVALPRTPGLGWMNDVVLQKNGKLVVLGTRRPNRQGGYALTRLLPNGSRDRNFGTGGMATVELGRGGGGRRVGIQPDGKLVVASMVGMSRPVLTVTRHLP